jgi:16S rRNA processing protein RimM
VLRAPATGSRPSLTSSTTDDDAEPPLLEVGRVVKPHGLGGEVVVELSTDRIERLHPGASLHTDAGVLLVETARPHQSRHLVRFAGVGDRADADRLRGTVLMARAMRIEGVLWVHELVGAEAVASDGRPLGTVVAVEANPASDLLVLEGGGLVPLRFVTSLEPGRRVTVDVPADLVD